MEVNSFHNTIKMEGGAAAAAAGWPVSATTPPHSDPKKVNPFMHWAIINSGLSGGFYFPGAGGQQHQQNGSTPPSDLSGRTSLECRYKYCGFKTKQKVLLGYLEPRE